MSNPFSNFKNKVVIAMMNEICGRRKIKPEQLLESLIKSEYQRLK
jgi:hypothetical protein